MMEDKYNELISEGKSDNEAIGIVISEFGNLDELADSLGIKSFVDPSQAMPAANTLSTKLQLHFSGIQQSTHISLPLECCFA